MTTSIASTGSAASAAASTPATGSAAATQAAKVTFGSDMTTFLKLLTTQLKNQDPLSPLDTNQFTQQLVSFSQVEQAINANSKLDNLIALQGTGEALNAMPLVGHTVTYSDSKLVLSGGTTEFGYTMPSTASSATLTISDSSGRVVYKTNVLPTAGTHGVTWDGKGTDGSQNPDGVYNFSVSGVAADGTTVTATTNAKAAVQSVDTSTSTVMLDLGGVTEPISKVTGIAN